MSSKLVLLAVLMSAMLATAQSSSAPPSQATPSSSTAAQAKPAGVTHLPQAKSKEEYDAYNAATAETDPAKLEAAADAFAQKYPTSELRELLYVRDMSLYQHANNAEKVIEVGRKAIALNPNNPVSLVNVASALSETTHDTDLDHQQRMEEAAKDARAALANLDTGLEVPPNVPPERVAQVKSSIQSMAYETLGVVDMDKKDFAAAEQDLQQAAEASKNQPEAVVYLRLSVAQDNLKKYPQALESANKAVQYAPDGSAEQNLAKQQQARVQKLMSSDLSASPSASAPPAQQPSAPAAPATQPPTPH